MPSRSIANTSGGSVPIKLDGSIARLPLSDVSNTRSRQPSINCSQHGKLAGGVPSSVPLKIPRVKRRAEPYSQGIAQESEGSSAASSVATNPKPFVQGFSIENMSTCSTSASSACRDDDAQLAHEVEMSDVAEYFPDMCLHMQKEEFNCNPSPDYMDRQPELNPRMRAILVGWLADVCRSYKLRSETLFLAIGLIDRYLDKRTTTRRRLQLVGVTALLVAAKFEETRPPKVQNLINMTDKVYTFNEVMNMEMSLLTALDFKIFRPTAVHFLRHYQRSICSGELRDDLAQHLLDLTLADYRMLQYTPSHVASAALLVTSKLEQRHPAWTPQAVTQTKKSELMLKACATQICDLLENSKFAGHWRDQVPSATQNSAVMN